MLTRLYVDNFRCFVNFEYRPGRRQLILGENGVGKTSLLDALFAIRQFVVAGGPAKDLFRPFSKTRWTSQPVQTFQVEATLDSDVYLYRLVIGWEGDGQTSKVESETLKLAGETIFDFNGEEIRLFRSESDALVYPAAGSSSALASVPQRHEFQAITRFKFWLAGLLCFRLNPFAMPARSETENLAPNVQLDNFAAWYRHLVQQFPEENDLLRQDLRESWESFSVLKTEHLGESIKALTAVFHDPDGKAVPVFFNELSDGQRCLICLYAILRFVVSRGGTVVIDEPENFITLRELQPWLVALSEAVDEGNGQVLLISHHPEFINQWAPEFGVFLVRERGGPVRVEPFQGDPDSSLSPSELIARGWERE